MSKPAEGSSKAHARDASDAGFGGGWVACQAAVIGEQWMLEIEPGVSSNRARLRHRMQVKTRNMGGSGQVEVGDVESSICCMD